MKVSWRNSGEEPGTFNHNHLFMNGEKREGKNPREFMVHLIRASTASEVALNDKSIWKLGSGNFANAEELVVRAMMGEPRDASILVSVDYNVQGDWLDHECRGCGGLYGTHADCPTLSDIDSGWGSVVE